MRKWSLCSILILLLAPSRDAVADTCVVQEGDSLSELAVRHEVTVEQLREWNGLDGDLIRVGQTLVLSEEDAGIRYQVQAGDTLSEIAAEHEVSLDDLLSWNADLNPDVIREGQTLRIQRTASLGAVGHDAEPEETEAPARQRRERAPRRRYRVRRGDSFSSIAHAFGVTMHEVQRWNPRVQPRRLQPGIHLVIYSERGLDLSESVGKPNDGSLRNAEQLRPHRGFVIRDRGRSWGTRETLEVLHSAFSSVLTRHPNAPRARVHDISHRRGGQMTDHRSHQSGRDVDVTYYQRRGCRGPNGCPYRNIGPQHLDAELQWTLFQALLLSGQVDAIFVDYSLQAPLYQEAVRRGATRQQLHRWFQYPRGDDHPVGAIRHFRNHANHFHLRLRCPRGDEECE